MNYGCRGLRLPNFRPVHVPMCFLSPQIEPIAGTLLVNREVPGLGITSSHGSRKAFASRKR